MRSAYSIVLAAAACGSPHATTISQSRAVAPARIAVASGLELRVLDVSPAGTKVTRSAQLPGRIDDLDWIGDDPVVLVQQTKNDMCGAPADVFHDPDDYAEIQRECVGDPKADGTIGRVTASGFVPYPPLPASAWASIAQKPKPEALECVRDCWRMATTTDEAVWVGHCMWEYIADGVRCDDYAWTRLDKPDGKVLDRPPANQQTVPELVAAEPSPRVTLDFESITTDENVALQMQCSLDGKRVSVYPAQDDLDLGMQRDVTWLASSPPIFAATHMHEGFERYETTVVFDSCKRTKVRSIVPGPGGLTALVSIDHIDVRRRGELVGTVPSGQVVELAPRQPGGE
jgi:hypothetical protein